MLDPERDPVLQQLREELARFNDRQLWALLELTMNEMDHRALLDEVTPAPAPAAQPRQTGQNVRVLEP